MSSAEELGSSPEKRSPKERLWDEQTGLHIAFDKSSRGAESEAAAPESDLNRRLEEAARKAQETLGQASEQARKRLEKLSTLVSALYQQEGKENTGAKEDGAAAAQPREARSGSETGPSSGFLDSWRSFSEFVSAHMSLKETGYPFLDTKQEGKAVSATSRAADIDAEYTRLLENDDAQSLQALFERYFLQGPVRDKDPATEVDSVAPKKEVSVGFEPGPDQRVVDSYRVELVQRYRCVHNELTPERRFLLPGRLFITKEYVAFLSSLEAAHIFVEPVSETDIRPGFIRHEPIRCYLALADVSKVQRGKGMNLRLITKTQEQYIFGGFRSEVEFEAALSMIEHTWRSVQLRQNLQASESEKPET